MTGDVTLTAAAIALIATLLTPLVGAIVALFGLLKGRLIRAENQVDTLLPTMADVISIVRGVRDDQVKLSEQVRNLRDDLTRELNRRHDG